MADINVERKGPSIWPWIVGLIVLALLIWALVEMFGRDDDATRVLPVDTADVYRDTINVQRDTFGAFGDTLGFGRDTAFLQDTAVTPR